MLRIRQLLKYLRGSQDQSLPPLPIDPGLEKTEFLGVYEVEYPDDGGEPIIKLKRADP